MALESVGTNPAGLQSRWPCGYDTSMTAPLELIRSLLQAHYRGDEGAFRTAAWDLIENERQLNRPVVAAELERILRDSASPPKKSGVGTLHGYSGPAGPPKDKDKNAPLLETVEPRRELESLILAPATRESLDRVVGEWRKADLLKAFGLRPVTKLLFHGPPGCGKTVAAEALARALYLPLATVRFDALVSSYLGETASNLRRVFDHARTRPMVLLFDEFDAIGKERTATDEHAELKRVVNSFLQMLDSFHADTMMIAATNHEGLLDPALWRRFDDVVVFPPPDAADIEHLLAMRFRQFPLVPGVKLKEAARLLAGASHADVERVAIDAIKKAVLGGQKAIDQASLTEAVDRLRSRLAAAPYSPPSRSPEGDRSERPASPRPSGRGQLKKRSTE